MRRRLFALAAVAIAGLLLQVETQRSILLAAPTAQEGVSETAAPPSEDEATLRAVSPDEVARIAKTLNCPLCQGYSLQECPLEVCSQMRDLIRQSLAEGRSAEDIRASFVEEYGPQVLNAPPAEGFFLSAWWTPVLVLLAGAVWLGLKMRRPAAEAEARVEAEAEAEAGATSASPAAAGPSAQAYAERVEALLRGDGEEGA